MWKMNRACAHGEAARGGEAIEKPSLVVAQQAKMKLVDGLLVSCVPQFNTSPPVDKGTPGLGFDVFVSVFNESTAGDE